MGNELLPSGEIPLYNNDGEKEFVSAVFKDETFWVTQSGMAALFDCSADNISLHLKNTYTEGEPAPEATTEAFYTFVQNKLHFAVTGKAAQYLKGGEDL